MHYGSCPCSRRDLHRDQPHPHQGRAGDEGHDRGELPAADVSAGAEEPGEAAAAQGDEDRIEASLRRRPRTIRGTGFLPCRPGRFPPPPKRQARWAGKRLSAGKGVVAQCLRRWANRVRGEGDQFPHALPGASSRGLISMMDDTTSGAGRSSHWRSPSPSRVKRCLAEHRERRIALGPGNGGDSFRQLLLHREDNRPRPHSRFHDPVNHQRGGAVRQIPQDRLRRAPLPHRGSPGDDEVARHQGEPLVFLELLGQIPAQPSVDLEGHHLARATEKRLCHGPQARADLPDRLVGSRIEDLEQPRPRTPVEQEVLTQRFSESHPAILEDEPDVSRESTIGSTEVLAARR
ncbi:MAG: hypothetical protein MZV64_28575 [Ignavibacteriales bacterium]|nr:hypothetical protein [Ignavibacteriales bacterium]